MLLLVVSSFSRHNLDTQTFKIERLTDIPIYKIRV